MHKGDTYWIFMWLSTFIQQGCYYLTQYESTYNVYSQEIPYLQKKGTPFIPICYRTDKYENPDFKIASIKRRS